jgi:hypothetical protein
MRQREKREANLSELLSCQKPGQTVKTEKGISFGSLRWQMGFEYF